jgi:hypothetical protein
LHPLVYALLRLTEMLEAVDEICRRRAALHLHQRGVRRVEGTIRQ